MRSRTRLAQGAKAKANPFFTIGHSTRPIAAFVGMLDEAKVRLVVDVRTLPRSRTNPQYNRDVLPQSLAAAGIGCEHLAALGGLRGRQRGVAPELNAFWENRSFHNYADYALSDEFRAGFVRLRELGAGTRCAIMCAEAMWWQCHRRIIADYLLAAGEEVFHILGPNHIEQARMTAAARPQPGETLTYPASSPQGGVG
ncbi:MAG TPA: DUF488 domain-containing protein [Casimicrobiaceae bacterium]|nr:DUF488 domain-containing protein [Casimicrobiaceae bacterium]